MTTPPRKGRLLLVPAPLDFGCAQQMPLSHTLPEHTLRQAAATGHWIVENAKTARAYLKRIDALYPLCQPLQAMQMAELPREIHKSGDHANAPSSAGNPRQTKGMKGQAALGKNASRHHQHQHRAMPERGVGYDPAALLQPALEGHDIGLLSEAGMPGVADPGSSIVRAAHQLGLCVVPLVGPVSLLMALAASGLNGQNFAFTGYLPVAEGERAARIQQLDSFSRHSGQAQILIETPYRNARLWQALLQHLRPDTWLSISAGLSLESAISQTRTVAQWRQQSPACPADGKTPAVFVFGC